MTFPPISKPPERSRMIGGLRFGDAASVITARHTRGSVNIILK